MRIKCIIIIIIIIDGQNFFYVSGLKGYNVYRACQLQFLSGS